MTAPATAIHRSFTIERTYAHPVARVFAAFSDPALRRRWFADPPGWEDKRLELDFRVGGRETSTGQPPGGPMIRMESRYHDIVPDQRIVWTYTLDAGDARMSVSLNSIAFAPDGAGGTKIVFTEACCFVDGKDGIAAREQGTRGMLELVDGVLRAS